MIYTSHQLSERNFINSNAHRYNQGYAPSFLSSSPSSGAFVFQSYWLGFCEASDKKIYREATEVRAEIYAHSA